jgi:tyrosyl-tRNA synthetase
MKLAREIVEIYHNPTAALSAETTFVRVFQQHNLPDQLPELSLQAGQTVLDVMLAAGLVASKSEGRRLLGQNGVRLDGVLLNDPNQPFPHPGVLQAGKRHFIRIVGGIT